MFVLWQWILNENSRPRFVMFFEWFKVLVGVFLILNFSVPLVAIARDPRLLEEPAPLLVFNMVVAKFVFGALFLVIGTLDVLFADGAPLPLCVSLQYLVMGAAHAMKAATVYLAVDQFVAIVHPLHYPAIMGDWLRWILLLTWCWIPIVGLYGLICYQLGMETAQEFDQRTLGTQDSAQECHWTKTSFVVTVFFEVTLLLMSTTSAVLFFYTALRGLQQQRRNNRRGQVDETSQFFLRFKSFKRIVKVLLTFLTLDIIGAGFRISSHWWPLLTLSRVIHLFRIIFVIVEAWTYGLSYPAVRRALRQLFCGSTSQQSIQERHVVRRPRRIVAAWPENEIEHALRFWLENRFGGKMQSMKWTGSIRWIHNPIQSRRIWIGLDQKFTNSADSGLDWIEKCAMCIPYLEIETFLLIVPLTSEVLLSNVQLYTPSFAISCRFYKEFGRYLLYYVWMDWTGFSFWVISWIGLD